MHVEGIREIRKPVVSKAEPFGAIRDSNKAKVSGSENRGTIREHIKEFVKGVWNMATTIEQMIRETPPARVAGPASLDGQAWRKTIAWLDTHSNEYEGRYVAVRAGELLADGRSFKQVSDAVSDRTNVIITVVI